MDHTLALIMKSQQEIKKQEILYLKKTQDLCTAWRKDLPGAVWKWKISCR